MKNSKSITRVKKSSAKLSDFIIKGGVSTLIPGGSMIYDVIKILFQHGDQYIQDRTELRLKKFHEALLTKDIEEDEFKEFLDKEFDLADYYSVLSSCAQDIEDEKTVIYSNLMQSLINNNIQPDIRRHFITSSKSLTYNDLLFLKELYIKGRFDLMTVGGIEQQIKELLSSKNPITNLAIDKLTSNGFIHKNRSGLTNIGEEYTDAIFSLTDLNPESINQCHWTGINIIIISYQLNDNIHSLIGTEIQKTLWNKNIKSSIGILDKNPIPSLINGAGILLVGDIIIKDNYRKAIEEFSKIKPLYRLNLDNNCSKIQFSI